MNGRNIFYGYYKYYLMESNNQPFHLSLSYNQYQLNHSSLQNLKIGQYKVLKELGRGSFAKVYKAIDQRGMYFALKVLEKKEVREEINPRLKKTRERLIQSEPKLMQQCNSPNLVKCYHIYQNQDLKILIMQYCNGKTLSEQLSQQQRIPEREAVEILRHIINGVAELHKNSIVHRDLKTDNIMKHDGIYKIIDFGFSKKLKLASQGDRTKNTILGTPISMAPEVVLRKKYGLKADIWSIGIIFFQLVFGVTPYDMSNARNFFKQIEKIFDQKEPLSYRDIVLSAEAHDFLRSVLKVNPDERLSWREMIEHPLTKIKEQQPITGRFIQRHEMFEPKVIKQLSEGSLLQNELGQVYFKSTYPQPSETQQQFSEVGCKIQEQEIKEKSLIGYKIQELRQRSQPKEQQGIAVQPQSEKKNDKLIKKRFDLDKLIERERVQQSKKLMPQQKSQVNQLERENFIKTGPKKSLHIQQEILDSSIEKQTSEYNQCLLFHLQCLKTQFLYQKVIEPIQSRSLLDLRERDSIQLIYLLISRCFKNLSPLKQKLKKSKPIHSSFRNLDQQIERLYNKVVVKFKMYDQKLKELQDQPSQKVKDFFLNIFNSSEQNEKDMMLGGVELQQHSQSNTFGDFTKAEQIEFTCKLITKILPHIEIYGSYPAKIKKYLQFYSVIMNLSLHSLGEQLFSDYVERIVS